MRAAVQWGQCRRGEMGWGEVEWGGVGWGVGGQVTSGGFCAFDNNQ